MTYQLRVIKHGERTVNDTYLVDFAIFFDFIRVNNY